MSAKLNSEALEIDSDGIPSHPPGQEQTAAGPANCFHCGTPCRGAAPLSIHDKFFCCQGCLTVFELLTENGLGDFYHLNDAAGIRIQARPGDDRFKYLDAPSVRERLVDYADGRITRVTFRIPAIHCIACVWLLENLFRLNKGIGKSEVHFPRKEVTVTFETEAVRLSGVAALLASLGYEPDLKFSDLEESRKTPVSRRLWLQLGVAGFAFGNIMLFSISSYLGLDAFSGPAFRKLVGFLSLILAVPVVTYSSLDYWRSALLSLKGRLLNIEVPIAAGIAALFIQSAYEVISGRGDGYFDSLTGLIFFLLCGRLFQQKTFSRLAFDRDYRSFFPLSVTRVKGGREQQTALSELATGDRLIIRNGELIPADARLADGPAMIDYSFVTGESEPVEKKPGDYLYAGGRQIGGAITIETVKPVSQSYLTSLWNQEAFRKEKSESLDSLTNRYSQRFTRIVLGIAVGSALYWWFRDPSLSIKAFTSVLIVACPCALALAAPFTLGTALRVLGRRQIFVKSTQVIETLARTNMVVFDKTGTLTAAGAGSISFTGDVLTPDEQHSIFSLSRHSTHPYAVRISAAMGGGGPASSTTANPERVRSFLEIPGCGIEGNVAGHEIWMGSAAWLASRNVTATNSGVSPTSVVHLAIDGKYRGCFTLASAVRARTGQLVANLASTCDLALLSGDNEKDSATFRALFGPKAHLQFNQSPLDKFTFIRRSQTAGRTVMMVGDGLNDAGALKQSDVGVAVVENISAFSPASDIIMSAGRVPQIGSLLRFSKDAVRVVRLSFLISSLYNAIGISIAAAGLLSPIVCAILMPISSITVVAFACGATGWIGGRRLSLPALENAAPAPLPPGQKLVSPNAGQTGEVFR